MYVIFICLFTEMDVHKTFPIFTSLNLITKKNQGEKVLGLFLLGG